MLGGFALVAEKPARVRYWTWRMRSSDQEAWRAARLKLLEIGRPSIDGVLAELVAREVEDRIPASVESGTTVVAFVGRVASSSSFIVEEGPERVGLETHTNITAPTRDRAFSLLEDKRDRGRRMLVLVLDEPADKYSPVGYYRELLVVALPEDHVLARSVIDAAKARLGAAHR
jgi:hypothetical protein